MDLNPPMYLSFSDATHFQGMGGDSQLLGLSLQEMIDTDIKAEFDDISCGNTSGSYGNMDSLDLLNDIDFKLDDRMLGSSSLLSNYSWGPSNSLGSRSGIYDTTLSNGSAFSNSYLEDMTGATSVMVNPNNVMPVHNLQQQQQQQQQQHNAVTQLSINTQQYSNIVTSHANSPGSFEMHSPVIMTQAHFSNVGSSSVPVNRGIKTIKIMAPVSSPMQQVLSPKPTSQVVRKKQLSHPPGYQGKDTGFPKPAYSYSCLIALALKNSQTGAMSVSEIYKFMCEHFPYFKTAPSGWKNSVRHNLSLNKCFEKIEKPMSNGNQRKGCLWGMNPAKITKMEDEVAKWSRKDPMGIKKGMRMPETLEMLERGQMVRDYNSNINGADSEDDEDPRTPTSVSSQGSHGYDSAGSDFVDVEGFTTIPDSSLPELNIQASGGIFEEIESGSPSFFHANFSVAMPNSNTHNQEQKPYNTLVLHKQEGQKIFSI